jgi:hypothetical protein
MNNIRKSRWTERVAAMPYRKIDPQQYQEPEGSAEEIGTEQAQGGSANIAARFENPANIPIDLITKQLLDDFSVRITKAGSGDRSKFLIFTSLVREAGLSAARELATRVAP